MFGINRRGLCIDSQFTMRANKTRPDLPPVVVDPHRRHVHHQLIIGRRHVSISRHVRSLACECVPVLTKETRERERSV